VNTKTKRLLIALGLAFAVGVCAVWYGDAHGATEVRVMHGAAHAQKAAVSVQNPVVFAGWVPTPNSFGAESSTFETHLSTPSAAPRGGCLCIWYPDGTWRDLTAAAGFGHAGLQDATSIAVRDPYVSFDATKIVFSMIVGAPPQFGQQPHFWQLYEITNFAEGQTPHITLVPNQPATFNNVQPSYASDGGYLFGSDRTRDGTAFLYPQLDEYESQPTVTGIWKLDPSGFVWQVTDAPSGDQYPSLDAYGRIVYMQWDHLQRDQQCDSNPPPSNCFNYASESSTQHVSASIETFPEQRAGTVGNVNPHTFNLFLPWCVNQDGTTPEICDHIGRHEISNYFQDAFNNDSALHDFNGIVAHDVGAIHTGAIENCTQGTANPLVLGQTICVDAQEFHVEGAGQIIAFNAPLGAHADQINPVVAYLTPRAGEGTYDGQTPPASFDGRYRNASMLTNGKLVASWTNSPNSAIGDSLQSLNYQFRERFLTLGADGYYHPNGANLTGAAGIVRNISWYSPDQLITYNGALWETGAVEVVARPVPPMTTTALQAPELSAFSQAGVDPNAFKAYLVAHNLAAFISRNITSRDDADLQQPYNLSIPGGVTTVGNSGHLYQEKWLQIMQGDDVRGDTTRAQNGHRKLAIPLHDPAALAAMPPPVAGTPTGAVPIASDGSVAWLAPSRRSVTYQTLDPTGASVIKERYWIDGQPGEMRTCESCHGVNTLNQAGQTPPQNVPVALVNLLTYWKAQNGGGGNVPPVASFTFTAANLVVNFVDTSSDSDGSIASRAWTFGDGGTSTVANPAHTYTAAGTYNVTLTVTDNAGAPNAVTHAVMVTAQQQQCTNPQPTQTPLCPDGVTHETGGTWVQAPFPGCAWTYINFTCAAPPPDTYDVTVSQAKAGGGTIRHTFIGLPLGGSVQPSLAPLPALHWHAQFGSDPFDFPNAGLLKITQTLHNGPKPEPVPPSPGTPRP